MKKDLKGREYLQKGTAIFRVGDEIIATVGDTDYITDIKKLFDNGFVEIASGKKVHINDIRHCPFILPTGIMKIKR